MGPLQSARQDLRTLQLGLAECFTAWGGVPRQLLFDRMKSVLTRDDRLTGGGLLTNLECQRFAQHYDFRIRVCRPYRAQTKGKVERPIRYLRGSFLYGRTFLSDADLNAQTAHSLDTVANPRFVTEEQPYLHALPMRPYQSLVLAAPAAPRAPPGAAGRWQDARRARSAR